MDGKQGRALLQKYIDGRCTPEESRKLEAWIDSFQHSESEKPNASEALAQLADIREKLKKHSSTSSERMRPLPWIYAPKRVIAAAAAVLVFSALTALFFYWSESPATQDTAVLPEQIIGPGGNRAFLTLANGERLDLAASDIGELALQAGVRVEKSADGHIRYAILPTGSRDKPLRNKIETPRGGQFQVGLPDGTTVWLNAASSLEYFTGGAPDGERRVFLTGEAFFEVAKNETVPFFVETADQEIRVWGTHFNVNAYSDGPDTRTTLLEGSVSIQPTRRGATETADPFFLQPGQQARVSAAGDVQIDRAYTEAATAWKNGYFLFDNEPIEQIMQKIARWYDIDVAFQDINKEQVFSGTVSRFDDISKVLEKLEMTGGVRFVIETGNAAGKERRIIVMP